MADEESKECPFCRETIMAGASLCKHCGSRLSPRAPRHDGVCPYCKEEIHPDATRCKHCRSNLVVDEKDDSRTRGGVRWLWLWLWVRGSGRAATTEEICGARQLRVSRSRLLP